MFGLFKTKEISPELLKQNVTEAIINSWTNPNNLKYEKFYSFVRFAQASGAGGAKPEKFMTEKLRYITSVAVISLDKAGINDEIIEEIIKKVKTEVSSTDIPEFKGATAGLVIKSKDYARVRFSTNPRDAGKMIENKFCQDAFGFTPSDSDTDRRYTLYKALTSFERSTIFDISDAIRKSRV